MLAFCNQTQVEQLKKNLSLMYSTIRFGTASKATPQGSSLCCAGVGFKLAIKQSPARRLDHSATTSLVLMLKLKLQPENAYFKAIDFTSSWSLRQAIKLKGVTSLSKFERVGYARLSRSQSKVCTRLGSEGKLASLTSSWQSNKDMFCA
jgi:hypothetical protein